jgi:hypothetical protein
MRSLDWGSHTEHRLTAPRDHMLAAQHDSDGGQLPAWGDGVVAFLVEVNHTLRSGPISKTPRDILSPMLSASVQSGQE